MKDGKEQQAKLYSFLRTSRRSLDAPRHGIPDVGSGVHIAKPRKSFSARN